MIANILMICLFLIFQALVYRDGNLVSGSLEALVQHMVPTEEYYPDRAYLFAFLLSARLFIKPHELLGEVCALCEHQQNLNGEGGKVSHLLLKLIIIKHLQFVLVHYHCIFIFIFFFSLHSTVHLNSVDLNETSVAY